MIYRVLEEDLLSGRNIEESDIELEGGPTDSLINLSSIGDEYIPDFYKVVTFLGTNDVRTNITNGSNVHTAQRNVQTQNSRI